MSKVMGSLQMESEAPVSRSAFMVLLQCSTKAVGSRSTSQILKSQVKHPGSVRERGSFSNCWTSTSFFWMVALVALVAGFSGNLWTGFFGDGLARFFLEVINWIIAQVAGFSAPNKIFDLVVIDNEEGGHLGR